MQVTPSPIPEVQLIEPKVFGGARGFFMETWQRDRFAAAENRRMLWVPPGFAHGFQVTSERAEYYA